MYSYREDTSPFAMDGGSVSTSAAASPPYRPSTEPRRSVGISFRVHRDRRHMSRPPVRLACLVPLTGAEAVALEMTLAREFELPRFVTVFSVVRSDEARFAPPLPLLLLHGIIDADEQTVDVDAVVRPFIQARPHLTLRPPPPPPLPVDELIRGSTSIGAELLLRLQRDRVVRLRADDALAATLAACYGSMPAFFGQPTRVKAGLHCKTGSPGDESDHAYAGMGSDSGREWLQLRRRYATAAAPEDCPPGCCMPDGTPVAFAAAFDGLRALASACLRSLALTLGADPSEWEALTDLAEVAEPPAQLAGAEAVPGRCGRTAGPSVMRLYKYYPYGRGSGCHAHADLGLLTLSPAPTLPGLLVYDSEGLEWYEAEAGLAPGEITLFVGESLSFISNGALPSPLHRVPPPHDEAVTRYSMPFFVRAHPEAILAPLRCSAARGREKPHGGALDDDDSHAEVRSCESFVLERLFRRRPWRQFKVAGADCTPDY